MNKQYQTNDSYSKVIFKFTIFSFITCLIGYFAWIENKIRTTEIIENCMDDIEHCTKNIKAMETIVKARVILRSFDFENVDLQNSHLKHGNFKQTNFQGSNLRNANLSGANFHDANLSKSNLENTNLVAANFYDTNLAHTNLKNANLSQANLYGANLFGAYLINTKNLQYSQIKSSCNWKNAFYKGSWNNKTKKWIVDREANQEYIQSIQHHLPSEPKEAIDCSQW